MWEGTPEYFVCAWCDKLRHKTWALWRGTLIVCSMCAEHR